MIASGLEVGEIVSRAPVSLVGKLPHQVGYGLVELPYEVVVACIRVLDDVVEYPRAEGLLVVGHVLQYAVDLDYVGEEVGPSLVVQLAFVLLAGVL